ncbi:hypothetical protein O7602_09995 [Micromonospora sp. WMMD1128]|uniref:outer membrane protein assembly factor BamB family protein n=1 Tax=Micromonospora sp. WMMD1128 TaxID=3015150 RepID=UPI00248B43AD|nr:PQQ-binding-like beta-propeller repeat protein [Micromonospora sp. WMMD1128]WBB75809.1 hypothetical protein O7602_09995 [Micromonospora sp. WMMD1128]
MSVSVESTRDIAVPARHLCGLVWSGELLWFSEAEQGRILAVDSATGAVARQFACPEVRTDLTVHDGRLVQVVGADRALRAVDPETGAVVAETPGPRPGHTLCGLEASRHGTWFGYEDLRVIDRRADDGRLLDSIPVTGAVAGITTTDRHLVYADHAAGTLTVVDPERRREIATYRAPGHPTGVAWDGSRIWFCDYTTSHLRAVTLPALDA